MRQSKPSVPKGVAALREEPENPTSNILSQAIRNIMEEDMNMANKSENDQEMSQPLQHTEAPPMQDKLSVVDRRHSDKFKQQQELQITQGLETINDLEQRIRELEAQKLDLLFTLGAMRASLSYMDQQDGR